MLKVSIFKCWYEIILRLTSVWCVSRLRMMLIPFPSANDPELWKWSIIKLIGDSMTIRIIFTGLLCWRPPLASTFQGGEGGSAKRLLLVRLWKWWKCWTTPYTYRNVSLSLAFEKRADITHKLSKLVTETTIQKDRDREILRYRGSGEVLVYDV